MDGAPLTLVIARAGGHAALARNLGITSQAISQWDRVPVGRVLEVERLTGIPRHEIRPDIYPDPAPDQDNAARRAG